jgi:hypothetical protein
MDVKIILKWILKKKDLGRQEEDWSSLTQDTALWQGLRIFGFHKKGEFLYQVCNDYVFKKKTLVRGRKLNIISYES